MVPWVKSFEGRCRRCRCARERAVVRIGRDGGEYQVMGKCHITMQCKPDRTDRPP